MTGVPHLLGLSLDLPEGDCLEGLTPLCGFFVAKVLNEEGEVSYVSVGTDSLTSVECLGMARWAVLKLERGLTAEFEEDE